LKSDGIPLNKGYVLWTLRQLSAYLETLPKSYILPIEFETSDTRNAKGGFADVWEGDYNGRKVAYKSIRWDTLPYRARLKRKVKYGTSLHQGDSITSLHRFNGGFVKRWWKSLNHPNILKLIGVCRWDDAPDARLTMVSEWMPNGDIMEYIKHNGSRRMELV